MSGFWSSDERDEEKNGKEEVRSPKPQNNCSNPAQSVKNSQGDNIGDLFQYWEKRYVFSD